MKTYTKVENTNKSLKTQIYYDLGGMNYFTSRSEPRGYYLSVTPVEIQQHNESIHFEKFTAFSGTKILLMETKRKSEKGYNTAVQLAADKIPELQKYILDKMQNQ